jgi:hypothetical protein
MKKALLITILILLTTPAKAGKLGYAGTDLDLMEIGYAAASLGLAEANSAQARNPFAGFNNPAGLSELSNLQAYSLQGKLSDGVDMFSINFASPVIENLYINANFVQLQVIDIPLTDIEEATATTDIEADGYSAYHSFGLIGACAYQWDEQLTLGLSATAFKKSFSNIDNGSAYGLTMTPGVHYILSDQLQIGGYIKNFYSMSKWSTGHYEEFGRWAHIGLAYKLAPFTIFSEIVSPFGVKGPIYLKAAAEYSFYDLLFLRLGMAPTHVNAGFGIRLGVLAFDYAYIGDSLNRYSDSSRFSIGAVFGE